MSPLAVELVGALLQKDADKRLGAGPSDAEEIKVSALTFLDQISCRVVIIHLIPACWVRGFIRDVVKSFSEASVGILAAYAL